ncbi:MAG TPA: DUF192 domain-containing protein [Solirubrobacteraceae bacterium]|nr:DUF192 domain-containing protein [Solirubrobacteraceae bacterium]
MSDGRAILNVTRGTVVCEHGILADRALPRMRGLLGARALPPGEGLLLTPAPSVHTAFMRFPIDVVFLDRDSVVVRVVQGLGPWRAASAKRARAALELADGESARRGVQVGDWLLRVSEDLAWSDEVAGGIPAARGGAADGGIDGRDEVRAPGGAEPGRLRQLLLVSRDRRFRAVMAVLLHARGFAITFATRVPHDPACGDVAAEVVVIDAGNSLETAMGEAATAGLMSAERTTFFVTDVGDAAVNVPRVAPKWESLERLCDEISASRRSMPVDVPAGPARSAAAGGGTR